MERASPPGVEAIVTNPPFKLAEKFVIHALDLCPRVVMLLSLTFMEAKRSSGISTAASWRASTCLSAGCR